MDVVEKFTKVAALICEPVRARILWSLLDGKAYTATELAVFADISSTSASNHLSKLIDGNILKVQVQGRHRYFSFSNPEIAYAVEALAQISKGSISEMLINNKPTGIKFCRTCYDHLAGYVGVQLVEAMEERGYIAKSNRVYNVTKSGWEWLLFFDIKQSDYNHIRRPITRQCLDWSERRPHLAGQLGADMLENMFKRKWFKKVQYSRELLVTAKGSSEIFQLLRINIS